MTTITLNDVKAKQAELNNMISQLVEQASKPRQITIGTRTIELHPGERYAGAMLEEDGTLSHDVIVLAARFEGRKDWQGVQDWAKAVGGAAPSPEEFALIKANCADVLTESWYWTDRTHADEASSAWDFNSYGLTDYHLKSYRGGALAVRRSYFSVL